MVQDVFWHRFQKERKGEAVGIVKDASQSRPFRFEAAISEDQEGPSRRTVQHQRFGAQRLHVRKSISEIRVQRFRAVRASGAFADNPEGLTSASAKEERSEPVKPAPQTFCSCWFQAVSGQDVIKSVLLSSGRCGRFSLPLNGTL